MAISLLHQEAQCLESRVVCGALALQGGDKLLVLQVVFEEVPDGKDGPLADKRVVAVNVAVVEDDSEAFQFSHLVLVAGVVVAEVSNQSDEMCLKADDRRLRGHLSITTQGGEVLSRAEDILTCLPECMNLFQEP